MSQDAVTTSIGWALYGHPVFIRRYTLLVEQVAKLADDDPEEFQSHPASKLLECVTNVIKYVVPQNPDAPALRQGGTLGRGMTHWRRVKRNLPARYRLFFQFRSAAPRTIIYAWLNDESTLRHAGSRTDCYTVFKGMVSRGEIPNDYVALRAAADALEKDAS